MLSTAESEYVAATYAAKEALWLHRFISEVFQPLEHPITLSLDSQSVIALTKDGSYQAHRYKVPFYSFRGTKRIY